MLVRRDSIAACTFLLFKGPQTKSRHSRGAGRRGGGGEGGWVTGMRVFSLWGVNYRFWSHLGCLGWKVTKFARFRYCLRLCVKKISFRGQFKLEPHPPWSPLGISFEFSDEHPRHFLMGVSPTPPPCQTLNHRQKRKKIVYLLLNAMYWSLSVVNSCVGSILGNNRQ